MAATALYRKYRSQTFAEVVGQTHVTTTLAQSVAGDRLHHAYLFTGPRGTGKTSTARILAKSLNCEQGPTAEPCNACTHCEAITAGSHVDVVEIDAASHGGVDDVRDLRDRVAFAPASARRKVYIVDECHMLSTAGWNAFLKTVEEPPGHVLFVFATTEPHKVLDTILSRTQRFDFKRIDADTLAAHTADLAAREGIELGEGALELVVRAGDGSARDTLSILDQVVAFTGKQVQAAGVAEVLGAVPDELLADAADCIATGDVAGACALVGRVADAGHDLRQFAKDTVGHLRSLFLLQVAPDAGLVTTTPERLDRLRGQAARLGRTELLRAVELLTEAQAQMRRGATRLALEVALAKATLPEACGDPGALAARLDRMERRTGVDSTPEAADPGAPTSPAPRPAPPPLAAPPETPERAASTEANPEPTPPPEETAKGAAADVDLDMVQRSWQAVLDNVKQQKITFHAIVQVGRPVRCADGVLTLEFRPHHRWHAEQCEAETGQALVGAALERVLGVRPRLRCVVDEAGTADQAQHETATGEEDRAVAEAESVAETEAAEAAGDLPDAGTTHQQAIDLLQEQLGATVIEDRHA